MSYAKSKQSELEVCFPYTHSEGMAHFRFHGDYKTFCGRNCETYMLSNRTLAAALESPFTCKRCVTAFLK